MITYIYIIYYNLFYNKTFYLLYDEKNNQYAMINIFNILDNNLFEILFNKLYLINYFEENKFIGLNYIDQLHIKDILLVIPYHLINLTNNIIITSNKTNLVPSEININHQINKIKLKNYSLRLNNELYLKNIYNHKMNKIKIPIYLLSKYKNNIKVNLKINN